MNELFVGNKVEYSRNGKEWFTATIDEIYVLEKECNIRLLRENPHDPKSQEWTDFQPMDIVTLGDVEIKKL